MFYKGTGMGRLAYSSLKLSLSLNSLQTPFSFKGAAVQMENAQPGFKSTKSNQEEKKKLINDHKTEKETKMEVCLLFF